MGGFKDGKPSGVGTYYLSDGGKFVGEADDVGSLYIKEEVYIGEVKEVWPDGIGTWSDDKGNKVISWFKNGAPNGTGVALYSSGDKFVGELKDGTPEGAGLMVGSDGSVKQVGSWKKGRFTKNTKIDTSLLLSDTSFSSAAIPPLNFGNIYSRIFKVKDNEFNAEIRIIATDLEKIFAKTMGERANIDLRPEGVLENEIGKLVDSRFSMKDSSQTDCKSRVLRSGEDHMNSTLALVEINYSCSTEESVVFDSSKIFQLDKTISKNIVFFSWKWAVAENIDRGQAVRKTKNTFTTCHVRTADYFRQCPYSW